MTLKNLNGLLLLLLCTFFTAQSQDLSTTKHKTSLYKGLYLGPQASTNGWGLSASYRVNDWFGLRTGYEKLEFPYDFTFEESDIEFNANFDFKTGGVFLLADLNYTKNLYISAGIIVNSFEPTLSGYALSDYEYGDIVIKAEDIGSFKMKIESDLKISPYGAIGYQAYLGKRERMLFNFETGIYYMGPPDITIEADGLLEPTAEQAFAQDEYLESQLDAYKFYPVVKIGFVVKIF